MRASSQSPPWLPWQHTGQSPLSGCRAWPPLCVLSCFSCIWLFATLWTIVYQAPLSMGFSRQGYWRGFHALLQGIFPTQVLNPALLHGRRMLYRRATREASPHYFSLSGLSPAHSLSDEPPCSSLDTITCFLLEALALAFPSFGMLQVFAWSLPSGHSRLPVQNCSPHPNATLSLFISWFAYVTLIPSYDILCFSKIRVWTLLYF